MKFLRDTNENPPGLPIVHRVPLLDHPDAWITRWAMGMYYTLGAPMQPWSVLSMLKIMQSQTRERIAGPGITDIFCMPIEGTYEHKKVPVPFCEKVPVPLWDFVVTRVDRTALRFRTSQIRNKIEIADMQSLFETDVPAAGKGKSDGPRISRR